MGVAPLHLPDDPVGHLVGGELSGLLPQDQLPGQVEHQIAHFVPDLVGVTLAQGMVEFEHFLDQIGTQGGPGLDPVPRAPSTQVPDDAESASKR